MTQPWRHQAACRGRNTNLWFPETPNPDNPATQLALQICQTCPVKQQCLTHAETQPELQGIWGGLTQQQRRGRRARQKNRTINHGTKAGYEQHRLWGEPACEPCKQAHAEYSAALRRIHKRTKTRHQLDDEATA